MQYIIKIEDDLNKILTETALKRNMTVPQLISELIKRFAIDSHIMEESEMWKVGIKECADINLDWANL